MLYSKIRKYMDDNGIKQAFVCEKTQLSPIQLSSMLNGNRKITAEEYFSICDALNVDVDFFRTLETATA